MNSRFISNIRGVGAAILFVLGTAGARADVSISITPASMTVTAGSAFSTDIRLSQFSNVAGALSVTLKYNRRVVRISQVSTPAGSMFADNFFVDTASFAYGSTRMTTFQTVATTSAPASMVLATVRWQVIGSYGSSSSLTAEVQTAVDALFNRVEVLSWPSIVRIGDLAPLAVPQAKLIEDEQQLAVLPSVVTRVFGDILYVESDDRSCGIRVERQGHGLQVGDRTRVTGVILTSSDGERYIEATEAAKDGTGQLEPVGLSNRRIGGENWFHNEDNGAGQRGVLGGFGLNNIGLLVHTWGKVTQMGPNYLYIDDGSSVKDGTSTEGVANVGVRVLCNPEAYIPGDYLGCTAIVSCFRTGPESIAPQLLVSSSDDIRTHTPVDGVNN